MKQIYRVSVITVCLLIVFFVVGDVHAQSLPVRPGWGFGDVNHFHIGPPGQSVQVSNIFEYQRSYMTALFDFFRHSFFSFFR